jgi:gas vesicle protein
MLPAVGLLAMGIAIGATAGLLFAPSSGRRLRQDVGDRLDQIREKVKTEAKRAAANATQPSSQPSSQP